MSLSDLFSSLNTVVSADLRSLNFEPLVSFYSILDLRSFNKSFNKNLIKYGENQNLSITPLLSIFLIRKFCCDISSRYLFMELKIFAFQNVEPSRQKWSCFAIKPAIPDQ